MTPQLRFPEFTDEWQVKKLGESLESISSGKSNTTSNGIKHPIYGSTGEIGKSATFDYSGDKLLIASVGANAGSMYRVSGSYKVSDNTLIVNLKDDVDTSFVQYSLINFNINRLVFGSGQPLVTGGMLKNTKLAFPSKPEQEKIADFLTAVDERIAVGEKKLELLETYKRGVMQKIFSQQIRFKDENGSSYPDWEEKKLKHVLKIRGERNSKNETNEVFSVAKNAGVINQIEHLGRSFASKEISNYKLVRPGDIIYTKSPTSDFPYGIIKQNMTNRTGVVSVLYGVYVPVNIYIGRILDGYFKSWQNTYNYLNPIVQKGAKNTINIGDAGFLEGRTMHLPVSEDEQQKIANFLTTLDEKITAEKSKLTAAQQFKKALLQRMFV